MLPSQWKIHNVFHASLLTPYKETALNGNKYQEPAPDLIEGQPEWEVDRILRARRYQKQLQYLVRWKGFSEAHDSWEPASNIRVMILHGYDSDAFSSFTYSLNPFLLDNRL